MSDQQQKKDEVSKSDTNVLLCFSCPSFVRKGLACIFHSEREGVNRRHCGATACVINLPDDNAEECGCDNFIPAAWDDNDLNCAECGGAAKTIET